MYVCDGVLIYTPDTLPVYAQTHALRAEIVSRCDTILTWEQLRTPQVSSFVVKPILANVLRNSGGEKLSRGIIYSLMANCLQFRKEADENMANLGVSRTRALLAELLAIKLLKEFSHRELVWSSAVVAHRVVRGTDESAARLMP